MTINQEMYELGQIIGRGIRERGEQGEPLDLILQESMETAAKEYAKKRFHSNPNE